MLGSSQENYGGEIHISLALTTPAEQEQIVRLVEKRVAYRVVLYACTSGYPVPFEQVCLLELQALEERFGARIKEIGFRVISPAFAVDDTPLAWVPHGSSGILRWTGPGRAPTMPFARTRRVANLVRDVRAVSRR